MIYVFDGTCADVEFDCVDNVAGTGGETLTLGLGHPGTWTVVVDGVGGCGNVVVDIQG